MKKGSFIIDGVDSSDFDIFIQDRPDMNSPRRRVNFEYGVGSDGAILFDEESYDNVDFTLLIGMSAKWGDSIESRRVKLYDLFRGGSYKSFIPYYDDTNESFIILNGEVVISNKYYMHGAIVFEVPLSRLPWKRLVGHGERVISNGETINNPTSNISLPLFKITGSGSITLNVGSQSFVFKNINSHVYLDSELMLAYRSLTGINENENSKVYTRDYLYFNTGANVVTWSTTGSVVVSVTPRWRTLV